VVLKPVASTLGRLVRKVERDEDLDSAADAMLRALPAAPDVRRCAAFARAAGLDMGCDPHRQFLAEEFAPGPPRETDGLVFGDRIDVFGVTDQVVSSPPHFYMEGYLFPAPDRDGLAEVSRRALAALGVVDAGFSIEFRGGRVIEVNGRLGEDTGFPDLYAAALGEAPIVTWMRGDDRPSRPRGAHAIAYLNRYAPGTVRRIEAPPGVTAVYEPGERVGTPGTPDYYPHLAWALGSHPSDVRAAYEDARRRVDAARVVVDAS
jgi:hypothetical protein